MTKAMLDANHPTLVHTFPVVKSEKLMKERTNLTLNDIIRKSKVYRMRTTKKFLLSDVSMEVEKAITLIS